MKVARTVLNGESGSNAADLHNGKIAAYQGLKRRLQRKSKSLPIFEKNCIYGKYKVDYSEFSYFKGITIDFDSLEEGLDYAQRHNIKDVLVRSEKNDIKRVVNFDFLNRRDFIQTFHWIVSLSKRSNITGLYHLSKLKDFRWGVDNNFDLDLSLFQY